MHSVFNNLIESFKNTIITVIEAKSEDRVTVIKENSYYISKQIEDLMSDIKKFELISEEIFNEEIENKLKTSPQEFIVQLNTLKKEFPETSALEEMRILLDLGDHYGELGSINDFTKIEKFKIVLFLNAIMYLQTGRENLDFTRLYDTLSSIDKEKIFITIKRTLIHELSHILDSFQIDMNELLKDFEEKEYGLNKSELKAHQAAFIYHFWKENGAQYAQSIDEFNKFISKIEKLKCWNEIGPLLNNSEVKKKYTVFLRKVYNYFRHHNILEESGDLPIKKTYYVKPSDIAGPMTQSEKKWANKIIYELHPELLHPEMEPSFFNRSIEMQKAIVTCYIDRPELMRPHLKNEVAKLISNKQINIKDYYIK